MDGAHGGVGAEQESGARAWELIELAAHFYDVRELERQMDELLGDASPEEWEEIAEQDPALVGKVRALADTLHPRAWLRRDAVLNEASLGVPLVELERAAADALAIGSRDVVLVQLAARLLRRTDGFPALATGIKADSRAVSRWGWVTIADVLTCFRDGGEQVSPASICALARVGPEACWSRLSARDLARVTWALRWMR